ncbi:hypothetical protein QTI66_34640 [Variovorax sp. J22R133]|uniref:hypothetical protein n=1 Tax=Variovorax brevis TaxID=3053503 RepID=UPI002578CCAE|nr:hypothetical protein [Variovorax sp. J22R133]MDM0117260.1 hypothetical protein [Variovorax sp. J22R133]
MIDAAKALTARERLAHSRAEILGAMGFEAVKNEENEVVAVVDVSPSGGGRVGPMSNSIVVKWWHRSPMGSAAELGLPLLEKFARKSPGKLVAWSAGTGALLVVLKPWKLLSAATLVTLVYKGADIPRIFTDFVQGAAVHPPASDGPVPHSA